MDYKFFHLKTIGLGLSRIREYECPFQFLWVNDNDSFFLLRKELKVQKLALKLASGKPGSEVDEVLGYSDLPIDLHPIEKTD